ncbi:hypothetical protein HPB50_020123 [Hyalomma asiaticum]|uniref:Uncharacterized protein n=1 Tax=Hyalomma asiaticum TaxID=266040 RepID=A0ACB7S434_HYAAI|nr:hypothetical protein HPB50_020123 [Hyalomma asiaticum]
MVKNHSPASSLTELTPVHARTNCRLQGLQPQHDLPPECTRMTSQPPPANYDMAVKVLSDRFGRRDMLVDDHLDHLLSLAPVRSSSEVSKQKEALPPDNAAASPADQAELVKDLMNFIRVQIETREESGFGEPTSFTSKRHAQRDFRGPEMAG